MRKWCANFSKFSFNDLTEFTTHDIDQLFTIVLAGKYLFFPLTYAV